MVRTRRQAALEARKSKEMGDKVNQLHFAAPDSDSSASGPASILLSRKRARYTFETVKNDTTDDEAEHTLSFPSQQSSNRSGRIKAQKLAAQANHERLAAELERERLMVASAELERATAAKRFAAIAAERDRQRAEPLAVTAAERECAAGAEPLAVAAAEHQRAAATESLAAAAGEQQRTVAAEPIATAAADRQRAAAAEPIADSDEDLPPVRLSLWATARANPEYGVIAAELRARRQRGRRQRGRRLLGRRQYTTAAARFEAELAERRSVKLVPRGNARIDPEYGVITAEMEARLAIIRNRSSSILRVHEWLKEEK